MALVESELIAHANEARAVASSLVRSNHPMSADLVHTEKSLSQLIECLGDEGISHEILVDANNVLGTTLAILRKLGSQSRTTTWLRASIRHTELSDVNYHLRSLLNRCSPTVTLRSRREPSSEGVFSSSSEDGSSSACSAAKPGPGFDVDRASFSLRDRLIGLREHLYSVRTLEMAEARVIAALESYVRILRYRKRFRDPKALATYDRIRVQSSWCILSRALGRLDREPMSLEEADERLIRAIQQPASCPIDHMREEWEALRRAGLSSLGDLSTSNAEYSDLHHMIDCALQEAKALESHH